MALSQILCDLDTSSTPLLLPHQVVHLQDLLMELQKLCCIHLSNKLCVTIER